MAWPHKHSLSMVHLPQTRPAPIISTRLRGHIIQRRKEMQHLCRTCLGSVPHQCLPGPVSVPEPPTVSPRPRPLLSGVALAKEHLNDGWQEANVISGRYQVTGHNCSPFLHSHPGRWSQAGNPDSSFMIHHYRLVRSMSAADWRGLVQEAGKPRSMHTAAPVGPLLCSIYQPPLGCLRFPSEMLPGKNFCLSIVGDMSSQAPHTCSRSLYYVRYDNRVPPASISESVYWFVY